MSAEISTGGCSQEQYDLVFSIFDISSELAGAVCNSITRLDALNTKLSELVYGVNSAWLINCGALVFIMHGGFAMVGSISLNVPGGHPCATPGSATTCTTRRASHDMMII